MAAHYSITELAREFTVTPRTLRFYETQGILAPRRQGSTRIYSERDRVRLILALRGRRVGLSLDEIRQIVDLYDPTQPEDPRQTVFLLEKLRERRRDLINKISDIQETLKAIDEIENKTIAQLNQHNERNVNQLAFELG